MRILKPMEGIEIEKLGMNEYSFAVLQRAIARPNGMLITTGPTGSGKTTTLYAVLRRLNKPGVKIITLEDPVEYKLEGINQSQIDSSHEFTFAKGLRALLRQDPDIVMVGEIRDLETADTAINAALTGHLMLSTIHTNSASGAIPRFLAMGVKPFLLAPSLRAVMGQRLVRQLCQSCKKVVTLDETMRAKLNKIFEHTAPGFSKPDLEHASFFGPVGCAACNNTGYKGRFGLYEIFEMTAALAQLIGTTQPDEYAIEERAIADGMVTMVQDGVMKALQGITSLDEVTRVAD
jgi:type II secretory ATPase GspE/PulE/Tfp pilus assembly ATPase PilB-like protein